MTQRIRGISEIIDDYDAVFCDVWGVLHNGKAAFVDAAEALMQARLQGKYVVLVTNSPKTPSWVMMQLERMEVPDSAYDRIVTAGLAMQYSLFATGHKKFYFIGSEYDRCIYLDPPEGVDVKMAPTDDYKAADVIICAGPDYGHKDAPEDYEIELRQLATRKLEMYCGNPDVVVDHGDRRIWCAGAIAKEYEELGGRVYQFGKPFPPIYQLARDEMRTALSKDTPLSRILFVGDGIDTDLKGAVLEEMDACFVAGGLAAHETGVLDGEPDDAKLAAYLEAHQLDPAFTIGKLRW